MFLCEPLLDSDIFTDLMIRVEMSPHHRVGTIGTDQKRAELAIVPLVAVVLFFGHSLLALFDATPEVISVGYTRLVMVFSAYTFSMLYEVMSGYLRGFGISLVPALLTVIGVVGVRITWIAFVFPAHRTFEAIMIVYPISLAATAVLIGIALLCYRPSKRFAVKP